MAPNLPQYPVKILFNRAAQFHSAMNVLGNRKRIRSTYTLCLADASKQYCGWSERTDYLATNK